MNNSKLAIDSVTLREEVKVDVTPLLREKEAKLVKIIEAIQEVSASGAWSTLKTEVFSNLVATLEKELQTEAKKDEPDSLKLNRLAGQLKWAEKYSDLSKLEQIFRVELSGIRKNLNGK